MRKYDVIFISTERDEAVRELHKAAKQLVRRGVVKQFSVKLDTRREFGTTLYRVILRKVS